MPAHESLPPEAFSSGDTSFLESLEHEFRPHDRILDYQNHLLRVDPELFKALAAQASEQAPGDPVLHAFYFTELLLLTRAVHRIEEIDEFKIEWADNPPILSY